MLVGIGTTPYRKVRRFWGVPVRCAAGSRCRGSARCLEHVESDLDKLRGIGPKYREILEDIGVASIKELRHRNADRPKEMIEERYGTVVGLSSTRCRPGSEAKARVQQGCGV